MRLCFRKSLFAAAFVLLLSVALVVADGSDDEDWGEMPNQAAAENMGTTTTPNNENKTLLSIIFVTKRPGGYDLVLDALSKQTNKNYELICIDELAEDRKEAVAEEAERLGVNLRVITVSKPKTYPSTPFGIANAFNTGFLLARGEVCTILQDNIYLPPNFVERTLWFFEQQPTSILSYAEQRYEAPPHVFQSERLHDSSSLSLFEPPVFASPRDMGWRFSFIGGTMPKEVFQNMQEGGVKRVNWLECACCTVPSTVLEMLNGVDETLDIGDDCHERNLKERAELFGFETWNVGDTHIQLVEHHKWEKSDLWTRFTRNSNIFRWNFMVQQIQMGEWPVKAPNNFDLGGGGRGEGWKRMEKSVKIGKTPTVTITHPHPFSTIPGPGLLVRIATHFPSPSSSSSSSSPPPHRVCLSLDDSSTSTFCLKENEKEGEILVHQAGAHVVHALLFAYDGTVLDRDFVSFVVEKGVWLNLRGGVFDKLVNRRGSGGDDLERISMSPNGITHGFTDQAYEIMRPEYARVRPSLLFVYGKDPAIVEDWKDGLWAATRLLARDFTITYWNVHYIETGEGGDNPNVVMRTGFDFILGWGAFHSPADIVMTHLRRKLNSTTPMGLCIGGNAQPPHEHIHEVYDVLFYETEWYRHMIEHHRNIRHAFGINSNIFHPVPTENAKNVQYKYDVIVVGHFLPWKRHWMVLQHGPTHGNGVGEGGKVKRLAIGEMKPDCAGCQQIVDHLRREGVEVSNMVPPHQLAEIYRSAKLVVFPMEEIGGGERALLEARACGANVWVTNDNAKLRYLRKQPIWDEKYYYEQLLAGIKSALYARGVPYRAKLLDDMTVNELTEQTLGISKRKNDDE